MDKYAVAYSALLLVALGIGWYAGYSIGVMA